LPDLAIAALSLSPASGPVGTAATLTVTIKNGGKADAANFRLDVWHSLWATAPCGQTGNVGATIPLLGKGATMTFSYPVVFGEPAGNRKAIAFVDSQCAVTETSETNNQKSFLYTVTPLTVTDLENSGTPTGP
jgi:subtilase family serine protease